MDYAGLPHSLSDSDGGSSYRDSGQPDEDRWPFYSVGCPDDVLVPRDETCQEISELLGRAQQLGQYAFGTAAVALPDVAGLALEGGGTVPLPLDEQVAGSVAQRGHEELRGVCTLSPDVVRMTNPAWAAGLMALTELSSRRLGLRGVALQPVLSKLMVVRAGGSVESEQDAAARSVATMVVQLPSEYAGGDWVVREEGAVNEFRFDLGKANATAAFRPQFLVYSAGATCVMEEVTSGFCLLLVYSLCLPVGLQLTSYREDRIALRKRLVEALKHLQGGPDDPDLDAGAGAGDKQTSSEKNSAIIALVLSKECSQARIEAAGMNSLTGVDWSRLQMLRDANALLLPAKQLVFYFARIWYEVHADSSSRQKSARQSVAWFSASGEKIVQTTSHPVEFTGSFNFLNPGNETLSQLWESGERSACSVHERFAVVGWPASADIENAVTLFGELSAVPVILSHEFVSSTTIRRLLQPEVGRTGYHGFNQMIKSFEQLRGSVSLLSLFRKLGEAIIILGDASLAVALFRKYVVHLKEQERSALIQWFPALVHRFGWHKLGATILGAIDMKSHEIRLNLALELAKVFGNNAAAHTDITVFAIAKAKSWCLGRSEAFVSSGKIMKLLKNAMACSRLPQLLDVLQNLSGKFLRPVIDALFAYSDDLTSPELRSALASVAVRRRQWLIDQVNDTKKPFTWDIPVKDFPDATAIELFLQGKSGIYETRGFSGIRDARTRVDLLRKKIHGSLQFMAAGRGRDAFVQIQKAGGDFDARRKEVPSYEAEIERLDQLIRELSPNDENLNTDNTNASTSAVGVKRKRDDKSDALLF
ncbi:unnamed protein product [Phytophthora fragariaefolia]|uniref:Unnamed protein product n=1 Tax=Phytophthora fragariaefolia TaxID=1490495 RepID=A0A9W6XGH0_9STRA|nr:unnamed protein product [Phytophthora fragariaefolia]